MRIFHFIIAFYFLVNSSNAQKPPELYKWYCRDNGFPFGIEHLSLSSDGIFFYTISSESGQCLLSKGSWKQKGNRLYLSGWDSTLAYPKPKIEFVRKSDRTTILISVRDYFNKPFDGLALGLLTPTTRDLYDGEYVFADTLGQFMVNKEKYSGFFFIYQWYNSKASLFDSNIQSYNFEKDLGEINIYLPVASAGALDRGVALINFGDQIFKIKKNALYRNKKLEFKLWNK